MIEVYLAKNSDSKWDLNATVLPQGGHGGLAQDSRVASIEEGTFEAALEATSDLDLSTLQFTANPDRWPVPEPKFQIVNEGSHADSEHFGNYQIKRGDLIVGRIENFPKGSRGELIREALRVLAEAENQKKP